MNKYLNKHSFTGVLFDLPNFSPDLIVCIPLLNEPDLATTLASLMASSIKYPGNVLALLLFNHSASAEPQIKLSNQQYYDNFVQTKAHFQTSNFCLKGHLMPLPPKHAGVGLARKILMDEGVRLFHLSANKKGILVAMDGDSTVAINYFQAIADFFETHPKIEAASIYFEHPLPADKAKRAAIIQYELHLRYFMEAQRKAGLPTAFQTIGSSMAVRHIAYQKQGGMNKRKAGEDFYFLQKFARKGTLADLNQTTVYPSARISDRVPFGTGRAMGKLLDIAPILFTHQIIIFDEAKELIDHIPVLWNKPRAQIQAFQQQLPQGIQSFLLANDFVNKVLDTQSNTAGQAAFIKRFFVWFDGFLMMKYVHFSRDKYYPDGAVVDIAATFAIRTLGLPQYTGAATLLQWYRDYAKPN